MNPNAGLNANPPRTRSLPNGSTHIFNFGFKILDATQIVVKLYPAGSTTPTIIAPNYYTVSGVGIKTGGSITLTPTYLSTFGYPASGTRLWVERVTPKTVTSEYLDGNPFPGTTAQSDFEKNAMMSQELEANMALLPQAFDPDASPTPAELQQQIIDAQNETALSAAAADASAAVADARADAALISQNAAAASEANALASANTATAQVNRIITDVFEYTATGGETQVTLTGGLTLPATLNTVSCYINGIKQARATLSRVSSTVLGLGGTLTAGDSVEIVIAQISGTALVGASWGAIAGSMASQSDLQTALGLRVPTSYLDTDTALAANSNSKVATQKAVKAYADAAAALYGKPNYAFGSLTGSFTTTSTIWTSLGLSAAITTKNAANKVIVQVMIPGSVDTGNWNVMFFQLQRNGTNICMGDVSSSRGPCTGIISEVATPIGMVTLPIIFEDSPGIAGLCTYSILVRVNAGAGYVGRSRADSNDVNNARTLATILVKELPQ